METFWKIVELAINLTEGFILSYFLCCYLGFKANIKYKKLLILVLAVINFIAISAFNYLTVFVGLWGILICIIAIVFAKIFLEGRLYKQICISAIEYVLLTGTSILIFFLYNDIFKFSSNEVVLHHPQLYNFLIDCSVVTIFFFAAGFILKTRDKHDNSKIVQCVLLIILPLVSLAVIILLLEHIIIVNSISNYSEIYLAVSVLLILVLDGTVYALIHRMNRENEITTENMLIKKEKEMQENNIAQLKVLYNELEILRNDYKSYIDTTLNLADSEKYDELKKYVRKISESSINSTLDKVCVTGNLIVDGIINYKVAYAQNRGIDVKTRITHKIQNISDANISIILGHLIDNAIESCLMQEDEKVMKISIEKKKEYIMIQISNKIGDNSVIAVNRELKSTKGENHRGLGIKSVKEIIEKYYGMYDFYENDGFFIAEIFIHEPKYE